MTLRVVITGATGFIGSAVVRELISRNATVSIVRREQSDTWRLRDVLEEVETIVGDLRNIETIAGQVHDFRPDAMIHLAWDGVEGRFRNDQRQLANIEITVKLVQLSRDSGCKAWVGLGSQAEYGPLEATVDEQVPTQPTTLYGASKLSAGHISLLLAKQLGMRAAWLRLFSCYGPADGPEWFVPSLILALLHGERPKLTPGTQRWDYLEVSDVACAVSDAAVRDGASGVFNLGSGEAHTIRTFAERIRDLIDPSLELGIGEVPFREDQVMHLQADIGRLRAATGWRPVVTLNDGLDRAVTWFAKNMERYDH